LLSARAVYARCAKSRNASARTPKRGAADDSHRCLRTVVPVRLNPLAQLLHLAAHDRHQFGKHGAELIAEVVIC
jgi:hypothetical protein